jgi:hypothetical protein
MARSGGGAHAARRGGPVEACRQETTLGQVANIRGNTLRAG